MRPGKLVDLGHLGFCHLSCIYATNALSARVYMQHYLCGAFAVHREECFQNHDDEIHRGEIVVENDHLVHRRLGDLRWRHLDCDAVMMIVFVLWTLGHGFVGAGNDDSQYRLRRRPFKGGGDLLS